MNLSQKCQYALRGVFELSKRFGQGPVSVAEIAQAQAIPGRFLEQILRELSRSGIVTSRRGKRGGYLATTEPSQVTVGQVIRLVDGLAAPVNCLPRGASSPCPMGPGCVFQGVWERAHQAVAAVYDGTTFADLIDVERRSAAQDYCI